MQLHAPIELTDEQRDGIRISETQYISEMMSLVIMILTVFLEKSQPKIAEMFKTQQAKIGENHNERIKALIGDEKFEQSKASHETEKQEDS